MAQKAIDKFWNFVPVTNSNTAELILYGDISSTSWWGDEVTPKQFNADLLALGDVDEIVVRINSGGGDVFAANAIYTRLKDHKAVITVKIDGWAGSAATIIAMAADPGKLLIPGNGVFMVHDPKMGVLGYYSAEEFVKLSERLQVIKQSIINGYALKTKMDQKEIADLMAAETWLTGEEAVEKGFCDSIMFEEVDALVENSCCAVVNSVSVDLSKFKNIPTQLLNSRPTHNGGGFSNKTNLNTNSKKESARAMEIKTVNELTAAYPDLVNQIIENATTAERNRIKDIENLAIDGFDEIVNEAKYTKPVAAANVAMAIIAKQKEMGVNYLENRAKDVDESNVKDAGTVGQEGAKGEKKNLYDEAIDKLFPAKTK